MAYAIEQQKNNLNFIENKLRGLSNSEERVFIEEKIHEAILFHKSLEEVFEQLNHHEIE